MNDSLLRSGPLLQVHTGPPGLKGIWGEVMGLKGHQEIQDLVLHSIVIDVICTAYLVRVLRYWQYIKYCIAIQ